MIRTARLLLRPARMSDLDDLHAVMADPEVLRYWSTPPHRDREETRRFLDGMVAAAGRGLDFVIEMDGRAVGKAGAWDPPEIGFMLRRDLWGRGLMAEALGAAISHIFAATDFPRLTADVDPLNAASVRLLRRLGFVETGRAERTFCVGGVWSDSIYLALPRGAPGAAPEGPVTAPSGT